MNHTSDTIMAESAGEEPAAKGGLDRAATFASCALAGGLFLTVGWFAMEPDDPLGAVSFLTRSGRAMMLIQAAALCGVTGALATLLASRRLADIGTFAAALGLALVSLRGATAEYLLVQNAEVSSTFERGLALKFALEAVTWFIVVIVAVGVSALVMRWCFGRPDDGLPAPPARVMAGYDIPRLSARCFGIRLNQQTIKADGIRHTLIAVGVGLAGMTALSTGLSHRSIQHGQVCFVIAAAVFIGTYAACRLVPVRSALWSIISVGLLALVGYLWAAVRPAVAGLPPTIPSSHFMRALPIQFISVGTAAALAAFWDVCMPMPGEGRRR